LTTSDVHVGVLVLFIIDEAAAGGIGWAILAEASVWVVVLGCRARSIAARVIEIKGVAACTSFNFNEVTKFWVDSATSSMIWAVHAIMVVSAVVLG
jgi:hypothetical protein